MRFFRDSSVRDATNALAFQIATYFTEPDDGYIETWDVSETATDAQGRVRCIITARRLVVVRDAGPTPLHSIPYVEVTQPPKLRWQRRAVMRVLRGDRSAASVARSIELTTTKGTITLFGESPAVVSIRDAVRQAHAAPDGRARPSRPEQRQLEQMLPYVGISPEDILRGRTNGE